MTGSIPAGTWHLVGDGVVLAAADVTYDVVWRDSKGTEHPITSWTHHFDPQPSGYTAVQFEADAMAAKASASANDTLILRMSAQGDPSVSMLWIPNGDGAKTMGRIPSLTLPK
jgi:hypothetical protein